MSHYHRPSTPIDDSSPISLPKFPKRTQITTRKTTKKFSNFRPRKTNTKSFTWHIRAHTKESNSLISPCPENLTVMNLDLSTFFNKPAYDISQKLPKPCPELLKDYIKVRNTTKYEEINTKKSKIPSTLNDFLIVFSYIKASFSELCQLICKNWVFEIFIISVILANTLTLALDSVNSIPPEVDYGFLVIYTIEAGLKILSDGLITTKNAYLKDKWNVLDLVIVLTGWIQNFSINLKSLRILRILRPLRNISSIKGMKVIFMALIKASIPLLRILGVLFFFILIFSITGLETMMGKFRYRCMDLDTGVYGMDQDRCGSEDCEGEMICVNSLDNPNSGISSYDNIFYAVVMVFECVTLQTWVSLMEIAMKTVSPWVMVFYIPLAFIGAFFILNLTLAIIKSAFTKSITKVNKKREESFLEHEEILDYSFDDDFVFRNDDRSRKRTSTRAKLLTLKFDQNQELADEVIPTNRIHPELEHVPIRSRNLPSTSLKFRSSLRHSIPKRPCNKSKSTLIIPNTFDTNQLGETELINFQKWTNDLKPSKSSMAQRIFTYSSSEIKEKFENSSEFSTGYYLKSLQNCIKIRKNLIKQLKKTMNVDSIKILISESYCLVSSSFDDVMPKPSGFEAIIGTKTQSYAFEYKENSLRQQDELEEKWKADSERFKEKYLEYFTDLSIFSFLKLKKGSYQAFLAIAGHVLEKVKSVELADYLKGNIEGHWSGFDVDFDHKRQNFYVQKMSQMTFSLWPLSPWDKLKKLQYIFKKIEESKKFWVFMIICVILNALILSLEHYSMPSKLEEFLIRGNFAFTLIFSAEILVKFVALGVSGFIRDFMNIIDSVIIILAWFEVIFNFGSSAISAFRVIRVFKIFRVIRIVKIFRYLTFMKNLILVISSSLSKYAYLAMLLILLNTIFALIGYQIFAGHGGEHVPRSNFQNFAWSFLSVFQVLTLSSYSEILYENMESDAGPWSAFYVILWIILGNFILLNLIIAILLDSFMEHSTEIEKIEPVQLANPLKRSSSLFKTNAVKIARKKEQEKMRILDAMRTNSSTRLEDLSSQTIYEEIGCEFSFFIFSKYSKIRQNSYKIMTAKLFDTLSIIMISANCIIIIWETYTLNLPISNIQVKLCNYFQIIFAVFYISEFLIKAISLGFYEGKNSYIKNLWNFFDFFLMLCTLTDSIFFLLNSNFGSFFKVLRALRPLRFLSKISSMKSLISALMSSFNAILNVFIVLFIIWYMFAILGVSLFAGKLYTCENPLIETEDECDRSGFEWKNSEASFDNIFESFLTLFIVSLLELWNEIMYNCIDARDIGLSPKRDYNFSASYYFIFFIFIVSFYFLKLFMGVLFFKFHEAKKEEISINNLFLSKKERFWINMQKLVLKSESGTEIVKEPENVFRKICYRVVVSTSFNLFIALCVKLNIILLSMQYYGASDVYIRVLNFINVVFVFVFFIEICLKLLAFGVRKFFYSPWNCFDCIVVICGFIDISFSLNNFLDNRFLRTGPQIIRVFRILRISRLLRVFKPLKTLNNLFKILFHSLVPLMNVVGFLLLFIFVFSIAGVYLFHNIKTGKILSHSRNFQNFSSSFLQLLYCSTLCEWPLYLYDCSHGAGKLTAGIFFVVYMSISTFVIINLFIMVIVQNYEEFESDPNSCLSIFAKSENRFKKTWEKFSTQYNGSRIYYKELPDFMYELGNYLGFDQNLTYEQCIKVLARMDFCIENDGSVFYKELLYAVLKKKFGVDRPNDRIAQLILKSEESRTVKRLNGRLSLAFNGLDEENQEFMQMRKKTKKMLADLVFVRKIFESWNKVVRELKLGLVDCESESDEKSGEYV